MQFFFLEKSWVLKFGKVYVKHFTFQKQQQKGHLVGAILAAF